MGYDKVTNQAGDRIYNAQSQGVSADGYRDEALIDTGVMVTGIDATGGIVSVYDETTTDSSTFLIVDTAGTVATAALAVNAAFNVAKDNAATINVYIEDGVVKVQNLSGGTIAVRAVSHT